MVYDVSLILVGMVAGIVLFYRFPTLTKGKQKGEGADRVSILIPARNEEMSLPLLLKDIKNQKLKPLEVLCMDDFSTDKTGEIAQTLGAKLIPIKEKPEDWIGKSWACEQGALAAKGDLLLFLDADVRIGPEILGRLLHQYQTDGCVLSVQPWHSMEQNYEEASWFFNLMQFAANGLGLPVRHKHLGLFGPVILISKEEYFALGGHQAVRSSIIDDIALGQLLKAQDRPFHLYLGDKDLRYRMYGDGPKSLLEGWLKNQGAGLSSTPWPMFILVFLMISSLSSVPIQLLKGMIEWNSTWILVSGVFYGLWVLLLYRMSKPLGNFSLKTLVLYPLPLLFYLVVVLVSLIKKILGLSVTWKGRSVSLRR